MKFIEVSCDRVVGSSTGVIYHFPEPHALKFVRSMYLNATPSIAFRRPA
jgi:hypothetical protein